MAHSTQFVRSCLPLAVVLLVLVLTAPRIVVAQRLVLRDGRELEGKVAPLTSVAETLLHQPRDDAAPKPRLVVMVDDDLRRYFVPKRQVVEIRAASGDAVEKFTLHQRVARGGQRVQSVDSILRIGPLDEYGRRTFSMQTSRGPIDIIQGITQLTPRWAKLEGLTHVWDQRIATSSIPRETLAAMLEKLVDPAKPDDRMKIARLWIQSERYSDAKIELEKLAEQFPELSNQINERMRVLTQLSARKLLGEVQTRRQAGQHRLARSMLEQFPTENVGGEILQQVRELLEQYERQEQLRESLVQQMDQQLAAVDEAKTHAPLARLVEEISSELGVNTLDRLTAYQRLSSDESLLPAEKLSLAVSGWLLGGDGATENLPIALSLIELRDLVEAFFSKEDQLDRDDLLEQIRSREGATPELVARLVNLMDPPLPAPEPSAEVAGAHVLSVPTLPDEPETPYLVQVPPEYDPHRYYAAIVTLHGAGTTASQQVDWWAGEPQGSEVRQGHASRLGYLVIAPAWGKPGQRQYGYTAREHAAVLNCLRDACRRFSIDTDRVYLSGHAMGGDAAWDLGLAHPDLWAGVIPIAARSDRYCSFYWPNAKYVPFYVVGGELDGDQAQANARDIDRSMQRGYDLTVAEYLGRGHEHFSDEILALFDWMGRRRRDFFPKEFSCQAMRPWDNYFWWVEVEDYPAKVVVLPEAWPPPRGTRASQTEAQITATNGVQVRSSASRARIWLSPELVDFSQRVNISFNGTRVPRESDFVAGDLGVLLEDVRGRGDRQHPFWAVFSAGR